jgi:HK97 family phage prohead protease
MPEHRATKPKPDIQYRAFDVRALDDGDGFDGHASAWWSVDSYGTAMKPGAFTKTLQERADRIPLLWQHDAYTPIGKPDELKEDRHGLAFKASVVPDVRAGQEALALLRAGTPLGMSFGFETVRAEPPTEKEAERLDWSQAPAFYTSDEGRPYVRVIKEVKLWEISLVTFPANEAATITAVRSDRELDALSTLLNAIRDGSLEERQDALCRELVAAYSERAGAGTDHSTPDEARHAEPIDVAALALFATRTRLSLSGVTECLPHAR